MFSNQEPRCDKYLARNGRFDAKRQDFLFLVNLEFEKPDLANLAICVKLRVRVVAKVFEQPQILPALRSDRLVPSAGNQNKSVYREVGCPLLDQSIIYA